MPNASRFVCHLPPSIIHSNNILQNRKTSSLLAVFEANVLSLSQHMTDGLISLVAAYNRDGGHLITVNHVYLDILSTRVF